MKASNRWPIAVGSLTPNLLLIPKHLARREANLLYAEMARLPASAKVAPGLNQVSNGPPGARPQLWRGYELSNPVLILYDNHTKLVIISGLSWKRSETRRDASELSRAAHRPWILLPRHPDFRNVMPLL